jgi:hypothetical protein
MRLEKTSPNTKLENLPNDILWEITNKLDDVSKICLRNTSTYFRSAIHVDFAKLSLCSKWLLTCRFETDYYAQLKFYPSRVACAFCKMKVHQECVRPTTVSNSIKGRGFEALELMHREPVARFCVLHARVLFRLGDVSLSREEVNPAKWTKKTQLTCMHCGADVGDADQRLTGCNRCECDVCPRVIQPRYEISGDVKKRLIVVRDVYRTELDELVIDDLFGKIVRGLRRGQRELTFSSRHKEEING